MPEPEQVELGYCASCGSGLVLIDDPLQRFDQRTGKLVKTKACPKQGCPQYCQDREGHTRGFFGGACYLCGCDAPGF